MHEQIKKILKKLGSIKQDKDLKELNEVPTEIPIPTDELAEETLNYKEIIPKEPEQKPYEKEKQHDYKIPSDEYEEHYGREPSVEKDGYAPFDRTIEKHEEAMLDHADMLPTKNDPERRKTYKNVLLKKYK